MNQTIKAVSGVTDVYDSKQAQGFVEAENYPIAWEIIYHTDEGGRLFGQQLRQAVNALPPGKALWLVEAESSSQLAASAECAFADLDSFRQVVHAAFDGLTLYDEQEGTIIPRHQLIEAAKPLTKSAALVEKK